MRQEPEIGKPGESTGTVSSERDPHHRWLSCDGEGKLWQVSALGCVEEHAPGEGGGGGAF